MQKWRIAIAVVSTALIVANLVLYTLGEVRELTAGLNVLAQVLILIGLYLSDRDERRQRRITTPPRATTATRS